MRTLALLAFPALLAMTACHDAAPPQPAASAASPAPGVDARRKQLRDVIADQWEYTMRTSPEYASILGDKRYNDRWSDYSAKARLAEIEEARRYVAKLEAIDTAGFPTQEALDKALLLRKLKLEIEGERFEGWLLPESQFRGVHLFLPQLVSMLPFTSVKDYDDYVARLRTLPGVLDQDIALMREGMSKGLTPPKYLLGKVAEQSEAVAAPEPEASAFAVPLKKLPPSIPEAEQARLRAAVLAAIREQAAPAYKKLAAFVRAEYEPRGRPEPGEWSLPLGPERYAYDVARSTTTKMTPDEIHELGLREVARIEAEMNRVAQKLGYADLHALGAAIAKDPAQHFTSRQGILDLYKKYTDAMYPKLPSLFGRLPKAKLEIMPVEEFREKSAAGAQYNIGTPDGSRPGHVMVNTGDFAQRVTTSVETTAYHEGVPGHHLQLTIAQEIEGLPPFRQHYDSTAFAEGWALYAERLGEEVGMYQEPHSYYGHLQDEMLRAIRLVVDTGLHAKKWTRQQVVDFFHAHSTSDEVEVQSETDRYVVMPGQACAYKIGQLRILELREKAKRALGEKFDVRGFHDAVLGGGPLPLDVLEEQVDRWVAERRGG